MDELMKLSAQTVAVCCKNPEDATWIKSYIQSSFDEDAGVIACVAEVLNERWILDVIEVDGSLEEAVLNSTARMIVLDLSKHSLTEDDVQFLEKYRNLQTVTLVVLSSTDQSFLNALTVSQYWARVDEKEFKLLPNLSL